jgi:predicted transcriptional regulator
MLDKKVTSTEIAKLLGTSTTMIDKHYTANMRFDNLIEVMNKVDRVKSTTKRHLRIVK